MQLRAPPCGFGMSFPLSFGAEVCALSAGGWRCGWGGWQDHPPPVLVPFPWCQWDVWVLLAGAPLDSGPLLFSVASGVWGLDSSPWLDFWQVGGLAGLDGSCWTWTNGV